MAPQIVRFGAFTLDLRSGELSQAGGCVLLPEQPFRLLAILIAAGGQLVTRETLQRELWTGDTFVDFEAGLNATVKRTREALGDSAASPLFIETLPRRGYRFIATIEDACRPQSTQNRPEPAPSAVPPVAPSESFLTTEPADDSHSRPAPLDGVRRLRERFAWFVAAGLALALLVTLALVLRTRRASDETREATQFAISPPENAEFAQPPGFAVSPDGRQFVFVADANGVRTIWLKAVDSPTATQLMGTEGASRPFWSPDSRFVGFFASHQLKKLRIGAQGAEVVCDAPEGRGGTWNSQDEIVFAPGTDTTLVKVHASGGPLIPVTTKDSVRKDTTHRFPSFLPDGKHFLFWAGGGPTPGDIQIGSLDPNEAVTSTGLRGGDSAPMYSSGHLLYIQDDALRAQPFDLASRRLTGLSFAIAENVPSFSVSAKAVLTHATSRLSTLTWLDRAGNPLGIVSHRAFMVALSADDGRVATSIGGDVELFDVTRRGSGRRFTTARANDLFPVWSPDGSQIAFASTRNGRYQIFLKASDFGHEEEVLLDDAVPPNRMIAPTDWSRNGAYLAYTKSALGNTDIWIMPMSGSRTPFPFHVAPGNDAHAHFSPNGKWMAFTSDISGAGPEVYVAPIPGPGPVHMVSAGGGTQPAWNSDGKELFFIGAGSALMSARVETGRVFKAEVARKLFTASVNVAIGVGNEFAVSRDGKRFLVNVHPKPAPITYVLDWRALATK